MRETLKSIEANIFYDNCTKNLHSFTNKEEKISFTKQSRFLVLMPYKTETRGPTTCRTMNGATMRKAQSKLPTSYAQLLRQFPFAKKLQTQTVSTEKLQKTFSYKKAACKMFMKFDTFMVGFVSGNRPRRCEKKNFVEANIRDRKLLTNILHQGSQTGILRVRAANIHPNRDVKMSPRSRVFYGPNVFCFGKYFNFPIVIKIKHVPKLD